MNYQKNKIYIFGHKNPDTDSVISSIALSNLKNNLGFITEPKILGRLNNETNYILKKYNIKEPDLLNSIGPNQKVILVDHNELIQSIYNIQENQVIEIIDHHKIGIITSSPISILIKPVGSTCTIISKLYQYFNIKIPNIICHLLLCGILSDTLILKSPTCTDLDLQEVHILQNLIELKHEDVISLGLEIFDAGSNINTFTISELIYNDFKEIKVNNKIVGISQLLLLNINSILEKKDELVLFLKNNNKINNYYLSLLLITDISNNGSYILYDCPNKKIIDSLLNCQCYQGIFINGLVSRKKQLLPQLFKLIN